MNEDYYRKAIDTLKAARILFEAECNDSCISRCYYSMFQFSVAVLNKYGIKPPNEAEYKHAWVQAAVAKVLIKRRGLLPAKLASYLPETLSIREEADYEPIEVSKKRTKRTLAKASEFIEKLQEVY